MHDGLVVVDKPGGMTSHDVVARLRRAYAQRRVGHAGTLDPDATGVLLVGLGRSTRLLRFLQDQAKEYRGDVMFGVATSTLDAAGDVLERRPMTITHDEVVAATRRFVGHVEQLPPMVSAVKVGGRRLHELAREGRVVERAVRSVRVGQFEVEDFVPGPYPKATVHVECSSGTYVRTLAADLGSALGGCAHLDQLRRLRVGSFSVGEAHSLEEVESDPMKVLLSPALAMRDLEPLRVDDEQAVAVRHGMTFPVSCASSVDGPGPFAVLDARGELLAVYQRRGAAIRPAVVLANAGVEP